MIKKIRLVLATVVLALITLLFLDFTGTLHAYLGWLAKIQLLPAVLALNVGVIILLAVLTLVMGRIYCSVICPLGIMQDVVARLRPRKWKYSYSPEVKWLRYPVLVLFVASILAGIALPVALLAPYSTFGRIVQTLVQPIYIACNNLLASVAENMGSYAIYSVEHRAVVGVTLLLAVLMFVVVTVLALRGGRTYCNTICPVGTTLSLLSRFSWLRISIDEDKCRNCGKCANKCKASCIDAKQHKVDYSRCVVCGNCLGECKFGAIKYAPVSRKQTDSPQADAGRRSFLVGAGLAVAGAAVAQEKKKVDGGLAVIEDKMPAKRHTPITPPGSLSARNLQQHCTACQLCVSKCPNEVLRPSTDLSTLMQPVMSYENGYCRPECNFCSDVCPTGAIRPITTAEKSSIQIGHAVWVKKNCLPVSEGVSCGNCARHCPTGAIIMVHIDNDPSKPKIPAVNEARCIGCGACEHLCPARPFSAIYVEGHEMHREV